MEETQKDKQEEQQEGIEKPSPKTSEEFRAVVYDGPVFFANHMHIMVTKDGAILEFRAAAPSIFGANFGEIKLDITQITPQARIFLPLSALGALKKSINEVIKEEPSKNKEEMKTDESTKKESTPAGES